MLGERGLERLRGFERAVLDDVDEGQVEAAGHAAAFDARARLRNRAPEGIGGAGAPPLRRTARERLAHFLERSDVAVGEAGRERAWARMSVARLQRPAFLDP